MNSRRRRSERAGSSLVVLTNIGPDGEIQAPTDRQVLNNRANKQWHADSSFKPVPAKASILSGRIIPSAGGNTECISMRAVYAELPDELKQAVEGRSISTTTRTDAAGSTRTL